MTSDLKKEIEDMLNFEFQNKFKMYSDLDDNEYMRYIEEEDLSEIMKKIIKIIKQTFLSQQQENKIIFKKMINELKGYSTPHKYDKMPNDFIKYFKIGFGSALKIIKSKLNKEFENEN